MDELEKLLAQRKELDRKIKELKCASSTVGSAKIELIHYPSARQSEWVVSVRTSAQFENEYRWRGIIRHPDKMTAVKKISDVIEDLKALQKNLLAAEYGGEYQC